MQRRLTLAAFVIGTIFATQTTSTQSPDARAIVDKYLAARGGLEKIRAVRSLIYHGPPRPNGRPGRWMARARPAYLLVGEPGPDRDFAEGSDGSSWEFYRDPG